MKEKNIYYVKSKNNYLVKFQFRGKIVFNKYFPTLEGAKEARDYFMQNKLKPLIEEVEANIIKNTEQNNN